MTILLVSLIVFGFGATHTGQYKTADECFTAREELRARAAYVPGISILAATCSSASPYTNNSEPKKESHSYFGFTRRR